MLPSFVEAHWLSPTSADDDNGGGIFHAVRPVRLGQATTRRRVAAARGEASGEDACGSGSRRRCEERRSAVSLAVKVETNHELKLSGTMKYIDQKTDRGQTDSDNVRLRVGRLSLFISGGLSGQGESRLLDCQIAQLLAQASSARLSCWISRGRTGRARKPRIRDGRNRRWSRRETKDDRGVSCAELC